MFGKKPFEIKIDAQTTTVKHEVEVRPLTLMQAKWLVEDSGKTAMKVIAVAAAAKTASEILIHIAKTKI